MLQLTRVSKHFGGLAVLREVSFTIERGEIVGLIGPNGAGKSTLFNLICGLARPNTGAISFAGRRIDGLPAHRVCALGLAKTSQLVRIFPGMSVADNALVGALLRTRNIRQARSIAMAALERLGLGHAAHLSASELGLVDRMRLELARALCTEPALLLVDELLAGLGPAEVNMTLELLRRLHSQGLTLAIIEHNLGALMRLCGRVLALDASRLIAEGSPEAVSRDPRVVESYLGGAAGNA